MRYRLIVITHGGEETAGQLADTIHSFYQHVTPAPVDKVLVEDGPPKPSWCWADERLSTGWSGPHGFCVATSAGWAAGAACHDVDFVYWLEHDFIHLRPVNLEALAAPLAADPMLAQMQMMRDAVNEAERAAGGLYESRPGQYLPRDERINFGGIYGPSWLEHTSYLTTNPCLMRRDFMAAHPWPEYESECEGRFGIDLVAAGYRFGVWGGGEPWVKHVGSRTGFGY